MLGRTNAMFVSTEEAAPIQLIQETILTPSTSNIWKIEFVNGVCFAFLHDEKVLYGKDMGSLAILKNGNDPLLASHVVYADGKYYLARAEEGYDTTDGYAVVLASGDLSVFQEIRIREGYRMVGLYESTAGKIVLLTYHSASASSSSPKGMSMLVADTLEGYQEEGQRFIPISVSSYFSPDKDYFKWSKLLKDRVVMTERTGTSTTSDTVVISLDGTRVVAGSSYTAFAHGYFYSNVSFTNSIGRLYYSINGIDYSLLKVTEDRGSAKIMEFSDGVTGIFFTKDGVLSFAAAESPAKLAEAMENRAVAVSVMGHVLAGTEHGGHTYIGCTGGVILKTHVDYSGNGSVPEVVVLKTLGARQALEQAKKYTDERYALLEARIAALEAGPDDQGV